MNKLSLINKAEGVAALVEEVSVNAASRMTGVAKNTILKLLVDVGSACADYQDRVLRNLKCKHVQCDELWQFVYAKEKNVPPTRKANSVMGMFGRRLPSTPTRSWFHPSCSATVTGRLRRYSLTILRAILRASTRWAMGSVLICDVAAAFRPANARLKPASTPQVGFPEKHRSFPRRRIQSVCGSFPNGNGVDSRFPPPREQATRE